MSQAVASEINAPGRTAAAKLFNKVPEITIFFWIIKVLATTVGETAADYLGSHLHLGLTQVTEIMSVAFFIALFFQFRAKKYVPGLYWIVVVLISIVGTLFSDNLVDNLGISLWTTTIAFSLVLIAVFSIWYASEKTLSVHTIYTYKREAFYWLAILFTFALGTSAGDLVAEKLNLGYGLSIFIFAGCIGVITLAHYGFKLNAVLAFWMAYILTRPLGASTGDFFSQPHHLGGLGLGTTTTSVIFLGTILLVVVYLAISRVDQPPPPETAEAVAVAFPVGGAGRAPAGSTGRPGRVLVITDRTAATPELSEAVRKRVESGPVQFRVVVPNPATAEIHPLHPERHEKAAEAEKVLLQALPAIEEAAGNPVIGSVSVRHDPMDAIEEILFNEPIDEIMVSVAPHGTARWLHPDLRHRLEHFGLPVTPVEAN